MEAAALEPLEGELTFVPWHNHVFLDKVKDNLWQISHLLTFEKFLFDATHAELLTVTEPVESTALITVYSSSEVSERDLDSLLKLELYQDGRTLERYVLDKSKVPAIQHSLELEYLKFRHGNIELRPFKADALANVRTFVFETVDGLTCVAFSAFTLL
jgi:hypothetical protein